MTSDRAKEYVANLLEEPDWSKKNVILDIMRIAAFCDLPDHTRSRMREMALEVAEKELALEKATTLLDDAAEALMPHLRVLDSGIRNLPLQVHDRIVEFKKEQDDQ